MLRAAEERQRQGSTTSIQAEGWLARIQDRLIAWVAERIAEQRLLWNLRRQTAVVAAHPPDMTFEQVHDADPPDAAARLRPSPPLAGHRHALA